MKIFKTIALCLIATMSMAQEEIPTNEQSGKAEYKYSEEVPGLTADQLYDRGLAWVNKFYKNPNGVLKTRDKESGKLVGRARFKLSKTDKKGNVNPNDGYVAYQITLQFKDGKYRYIIDGIRWEQGSYYDVSQWSDSTQANYNKQVYTSYIAQAIKYFDTLSENLEDYMKVGEAKVEDDW
ncbi:MAG: DUF4468 domain-containing protein [Bacteroidia bacterium]|nr:DUF4468 domain-containing protein [Bacteroidia bacterium]